MQNVPLVSVVVIFLDVGEFLQDAIESVLSQTYPNWELLLADDGSTDSSTAIALRYAAKYPRRIRYLEHPNHKNRGMSATRNLGIRNASGEYIALLDGDDIWVPHKLEHQVSILKAYPEAAMVYGAGEDWYSWTGKPEDSERDAIQDLFLRPNWLYKPPEILLTFLKNEGATPGGVLVRREVVERLGGYVEAFRGAYEDQVFFSKLALEESIYVSSERFFKYRRHPDASCAAPKTREQICSARLTFLTWLQDYLSTRRDTDSRVKEALRHALDAQELKPYRYPLTARLNFHINRIFAFMRHGMGLILPQPVTTMVKGVLKFIRIIKARIRLTIGRQPLSQAWGLERGLPIHRYYITQFLEDCAPAIRGKCLEFRQPSLARRMGRSSVAESGVLNLNHSMAETSIIAEVMRHYDNPYNYFDCIICVEELQYNFELDKSIAELYSILKPGGTLLVANPYISVTDGPLYENPSWIPIKQNGTVIWRLTPEGLYALLAKYFGGQNICVQSYGNSITAAGALRGLASYDFTRTELNFHDSRCPVIVCARATKQIRTTTQYKAQETQTPFK